MKELTQISADRHSKAVKLEAENEALTKEIYQLRLVQGYILCPLRTIFYSTQDFKAVYPVNGATFFLFFSL